MKKVLIAVFSLCLTASMVGCSDEIINVNVENALKGVGAEHINVENSTDLSGTVIGTDTLIEIGSNLWYDSTTRIVYWWNGRISSGCYGATAPTPYYAPNGLPYRYNPESNTFEETGSE